MDVDPSPATWLASAKASAPSPAAEQAIGQLESAYNKKSVHGRSSSLSRSLTFHAPTARLWHNLTMALLRYIKLPETGPQQVEMFTSCVAGGIDAQALVGG